jgi:type IV pilus assembly protein PilV
MNNISSTPHSIRVVSNDCRKSLGFSLLEVMIALLVLSIGLLGIAGLQVFSLRYNHQSYERTQAVTLIYDIADRMRANPNGVLAGAYDSVDTDLASGTYPNCGDGSVTCDSEADMALFDIETWASAMKVPGVLASARGTITRDATVTTGAAFDITVEWTEDDITLIQTLDVQVL